MAGAFRRRQPDIGAVLESDIIVTHLGDLPAQERAALEQRQQFFFGHPVARVLGRHGQHLGAGPEIHGPAQANVEDQGFSDLRRTGDDDFLDAVAGVHIEDAGHIRRHIHAHRRAGVEAVLDDDRARRPARRGDKLALGKDFALAGGEGEGGGHYAAASTRFISGSRRKNSITHTQGL